MCYNAIKIYLDNLSERPVFAVFFRSTAKGTYKEDSDIDILIITNNKISTEKAQKETDALTAMKISTFQIIYKDFLIDLKMKEDTLNKTEIHILNRMLNKERMTQVIEGDRYTFILGDGKRSTRVKEAVVRKLFNQNFLMFDLKTHMKVGNVYYLSYRNKNKRKIILTDEGREVAGIFKL